MINRVLFQKTTLTKILPIVITIILFVIIIFFTQYHANAGSLEQLMLQFGPLSVVIFVLIIILANIAAPISATPLLLLGFSIYGQNAVWLFALGNTIAMAVNFGIARKFGRSILLRVIGESNADKIDELSKNYGLFALFLVRIFLSGVGDLASYAFGLSPIRFKPYMIVSIIGALPPYLLLYLFSSQEQSSIQFLLLQLTIAGLLAAIFLSTRYLKNRFLRLLLKGE